MSNTELRKTKIICTIGPVTSSYNMLEKMVDSGMDIVRLNMSHGDHEAHGKVIKSIKTLNKKVKYPVPILLDTQGPEIRTGALSGELDLKKGSQITVSVRGVEDVERSSIQVNYEDLINDVEIGDRITVDNGMINLQVLEKNEGTMECLVLDGGILKSHKHVNLPGIRVNLPGITKKDESDIMFGVEHEVDFIALSFVRCVDDIFQLKDLLGSKADKIKIIAKIEDREGVKNLAGIIDAADGIMVARGDLGVEISVEQLPNVQRRIVQLCAEKGKRVIVATHLLESMIENPIPTRAEVTDVANAIYEEVDAIMLSGETAMGKYPLRCIEYLDKISRASEDGIGLEFTKDLQLDNDKKQIAASAVNLAESVGAKGILVITRRGLMANFVTNCHPQHSAIYAFTNDSRTRRQLALNRNLRPFKINLSSDPEKTLATAFKLLMEKTDCQSGDKVVVISDILAGSGIDAIQMRQLQ